MITEDSIVIMAEGLSHADLGGEAVILDERVGKYYGLNETGACILDLVRQPAAVSEILDIMLRRYPVQREQLERETLDFLQKMVDARLIYVTDSIVH